MLVDYNVFREAVIAVYGDIDRRGNVEDCLGRIKQTSSVAVYISNFSEQAAQVDWNEASLVARFPAGLKDEILDSAATAETQPRGIQEWMAMASRIDERLWTRRQSRRPQTSYSTVAYNSHVNPKLPNSTTRDYAARAQSTSDNSGPVPMELDATKVSMTLAKTAAERLEYQREGRCWGCGQLGHIRSKSPINLSKPLSFAVMDEA